MSETSSGHPIVVRHHGGLRFVASARSHEIVTDQPLRSGGTDCGATPLELLGAALGSCIALYVQQFCEARSLPSEGMSIEVRQKNESGPNRVGSFSVRVVLPDDMATEYVTILERVVRSCPVHNTLSMVSAIDVEVALPTVV
jgi:putative redox protein